MGKTFCSMFSRDGVFYKIIQYNIMEREKVDACKQQACQ
jgi:hypothetical protein